MNEEERVVAKRSNLQFTEFKIAISAVVIVTNNQNTVDSLRTTQVDSIFSGKANRWTDVGGPKSAGPILVCLPDVNNSSFEVVGSEILHGGKFAPPVKSVKSPDAMVEFVKQNPGAIGLLGLNTLAGYTDDVRILQLCDPAAYDTLNLRTTYFSPYPAYLYEKFYPLFSEVYMYSKTDAYSPGAGFIAFVCSAPGQKIIQSNGLVPATMPVRLVDLTQ
jgi:phosphate transport system substrate-binding protein